MAKRTTTPKARVVTSPVPVQPVSSGSSEGGNVFTRHKYLTAAGAGLVVVGGYYLYEKHKANQAAASATPTTSGTGGGGLWAGEGWQPAGAGTSTSGGGGGSNNTGGLASALSALANAIKGLGSQPASTTPPNTPPSTGLLVSSSHPLSAPNTAPSKTLSQPKTAPVSKTPVPQSNPAAIVKIQGPKQAVAKAQSGGLPTGVKGRGLSANS